MPGGGGVGTRRRCRVGAVFGRVCALLVRSILLCAAFARRGGVALSAFVRACCVTCGPRGRTPMGGASLGGARRSVLGRLIGPLERLGGEVTAVYPWP